jgi:hypothetical protein
MAILQGEGMEPSEVPLDTWNGGNHPGRLRFQSFRPDHSEPLTDATIGQGKMSLGGGGYGGGGLPYASTVLELWGGVAQSHPVAPPSAPRIVHHDGTGTTSYAIIAIGPEGQRTTTSPATTADGHAALSWDSVAGADAYLVVRDGQVITQPLRIEGSEKRWVDPETSR